MSVKLSRNMSRSVPATPDSIAAALDTRRNRVLVLGGSNAEAGVYDVAGNAMQKITLAGPDAVSVLARGNGMVYDPLLDAFLVRASDAGATVYRVNAQSFSVDTLPNSGGAGVPASANNVYTRFLYAPQLKGIVYVPTYDGDLWFLRTF